MNSKNNFSGNIMDKIEKVFLNIFKIIGLDIFVKLYEKHKQGFRYLIFGFISTIINIVIFISLKSFGLSTIISNFIAWIVSILFAYLTNKLYVFNSITKNKIQLLKEIFSFLWFRVLTLIIEDIYIYITIDTLHFNSIFMKIISNIIVIALNFVFSKLLIFNKKRNIV